MAHNSISNGKFVHDEIFILFAFVALSTTEYNKKGKLQKYLNITKTPPKCPTPPKKESKLYF